MRHSNLKFKRMKSFIDTPHYHLWTDALHARALANQANNHWDRGTYVRWAIITGWSVLEMACRHALEDHKIGYSFKRDVDNTIEAKGFHKLDWSKGTWQNVTSLQSVRKSYVHVNIPQQDLFPPTETADWAVSTIREAVKAIYLHCQKCEPIWVNDNQDRGWDKGSISIGHMTLTQSGAQNNTEAIRIAYVYKEKEYVSNVCVQGTDYEDLMNELLKRINIPISAVRAYRGNELIKELPLIMRGA